MYLKPEKNIQRVPDSKILIVGNKIATTQKVEEFYSRNPFPNYDEERTLADLEEKLNANVFLKNLKKQIGFGKRVLEVGSGTCQLSLVLAYGTNNLQVAFDPTLASIQLGEEFAKKNNLENCEFVVGDIFDDPFADSYFDLVWCSGVLHHTEDPRRGFNTISKWLKPGGYIVLGLYSRLGRIRTIARQILNSFLGKGLIARKLIFFLDPILRGGSSEQQKSAWFQDQYEHPVESLHSISEVIRWFKTENIEFVTSVPNAQAGDVNYKELFSTTSSGSYLSRYLSELLMLINSQGREGGLFLVLGRKMK